METTFQLARVFGYQKQMSLKQLKALFDAQKYVEVVQSAETIVSRDGVRNKAAYMFLAQAQIELGMLSDGQESLNILYSVLQLGENKSDDMIYLQALQWNSKLAQKMQEDTSAPKQSRNAGREMQKHNQFKIVEYFDFKKRYDKMIAEMETFMLLLTEDGSCKDVEDNLLWLVNHQGLSDEQKLGYAARIHQIDKFYNPYTKIEKTFSIMLNLQGMVRPYGADMVTVAQLALAFLERQNWRKDLHSAIDRLNANAKSVLDDFNRYCMSAVPAAEIIFAGNPAQVLFGGDPSALTHFIRAIFYKTYSVQLGSEEWRTFIADLSKVTQLEVFTATIGELSSNPAQLAIHCILDLDRIVSGEQEVPDASSASSLFFVRHFGEREDGQDVLMEFAKLYRGLSPFVNLYVTLCSSCLGWVGTKVQPDDALAKLNLATFLQRSIQKNRLGPRNQPSDMQVLASILNLRLAQHLPEEKQAELVAQTSKTMEAVQKFASAQVITVYQAEMAQIQWKVPLKQGKWQDAILELQKMAETSPHKAAWVKVKIAWIQYSFLNQIAKDESEKKLFLGNILQQLQEGTSATDKDAETLLMQGTVLFLQGDQLGAAGADPKAPLTKWLLALKRDQTNADTFYCLAVYYLCREKNFVKAQKCLDKALLLRPDFEEAFLFNYCLMCRDGRQADALALVAKMQAVNRNVASTYYLNGLAQLHNGNYIQAIDDLQNATRFYSIARANSAKQRGDLRAVYPKPTEIVKEHQFTLLKANLGLFGSHERQFVAVWVHLIQCFVKIDKPQVALKCFARAMEEIELILGSQINEVVSEAWDAETRQSLDNMIAQLTYIRQADRLQEMEATELTAAVVKTLLKINEVLDASEHMPAILGECIECLTVGSKITPDLNLSIDLALTSMKVCSRVKLDNVSNLVNTLLTVLLNNFTEKISSGSLIAFGNVTIPVWVSNQVERMEQLIQLIDAKHNAGPALSQAIIHALFAMSQMTSGVEKKRELLLDSFRRVEELITRQKGSTEDAQTIPGPFARSLLLDAAKIALKCELVGVVDETLKTKKLSFAKQAIMLDPENAELWVHLHLCLTSAAPEEQAMRSKAIFRAYQLDHELPFVQEHLLRHYLSSPKTYSRAFHMILRTTQQQVAEQIQNNSTTVTLPIVTAVLAFFNARAYFGCVDLAQRRTQKKQQLLEAISLVGLIAERDDLVQLFQRLQVFLQHQKGDYLQTIKYLEFLCDENKTDGLLRLMLVESYLGVSVMHTSQASTLNCFNETVNQDSLSAETHQAVIGKTRKVLTMSSDDKAELKAITEELITLFKSYPKQASSALILHQEYCLQSGVLPEGNVLDLALDVMPLIEQLEQPEQRMILVQSLTFCQMRDGEIRTNATILDQQTGEILRQGNEGQDYSRYLVRAARIKPKLLDSIQTHKDLLNAKLNSLKFPDSYLGKPVKSPDNPKDRTYIGLEQILRFRQQKLLFAQKALMREPYSAQAHIDMIWGLVYNSRMKEAQTMFSLLESKMVEGKLLVPEHNSEAQVHSLNKLRRVLHPDSASEGDAADSNAIDQLLSSKKLENECTDPEEFTTQVIDRIGVGLVKVILTTDKPKKQWQLFSELTFLLKTLLLQRRQNQVFNRLVERMVNVVTSLPKEDGNEGYFVKELLNLLWGYKCLNKASSLIELKKNATATQEANMAVKVLSNGTTVRDHIPALLIQARTYQLARNEVQASVALEHSMDDPSVVRDVVIALGLYAQQAYKEFYLTALGLVAGSKTQVEKMIDASQGTSKQNAYYALAYCYYLKAFAECTFLAARRQGLTLAEDFDNEEDGQIYDVDYFQSKALSSLGKAKTALWHARDTDGDLKRAIEFMLTQAN